MIWTICLAAGLLSASPEVDVQTLDGQTLGGRLVSLADGTLTVRGADGPVSLEVEHLLSIEPRKAPAVSGGTSAVMVRVADGSSITGSDYRSEGNEATVEVAGGPLRLPRDQVLSVRLVAAEDEVLARWKELTESKIPSDLLVIRKDASIDYHRGLVRDVTEEHVQFDLDGELLPVKRSKVFGIVHYRAEGRELDAPICRIFEANGSQWSARQVEWAGNALNWSTPSGIAVSRSLSAIVQIDFSGGKLVYLSDLEPAVVRWQPFFPTKRPLESRRRFFAPRGHLQHGAGPLELDEKPVRKAVSLHSHTELTYQLPDAFRRFKATIGIADSVRPQGHVEVIVRADGRTIWKAAVSGADPPETLDLDIDGASRLTIVCDYGQNLDIADHLVVGDARVLK